ncbi:receptor-like protein EIX1 [Coffea eugenioides]|uniref:receptor-like protein EIX1 n=1 Tax=Coffea eugenioides TaxID=49369 RepID=UPI000F610FDD|nr:receptor-like protein EIX1 [Coffea eugenioides]
MEAEGCGVTGVRMEVEGCGVRWCENGGCGQNPVRHSFLIQNWLRTKDLGWVAGLSSLQVLVLSRVNLTDAQDGLQSVNMLPSLTTLDLNSCDLFIHPHLSHFNFTSLAFLDLGGNNFNNYTVPPWLRNLTGLHDLRLADLFAKLRELKSLGLSRNSLALNVLSLKTWQVGKFKLSNNLLSGRVPLCLGNLRGLGILNLANNSLFGQIPSSLGNLWQLSTLHLNGNKFVGKLPTSMQHLRYLQALDLGDNGLKDTISAWIGEKLSYLRFLRFQLNDFHGPISDTLCQLSYLRMEVWAFIHEKAFKTIREEEVEYYSWDLLLVKSISLSANNLVGEIPDEIMELDPQEDWQLETLDLSMNALFGAIPESLSNLYSLNFLNLSHNKLSGPIPSGNQLQTLTDPSIYEGNSGLYGKPLPNNCWEHKLPTKNGPIDEDEGHSESDWSWFYAGIGPGFAVGLLGVLGILLFKKSWCHAYFKFIESACDKI